MSDVANLFVQVPSLPSSQPDAELARLFDAQLDAVLEQFGQEMAPFSLVAEAVSPPPGLWGRIEKAVESELEALGRRNIVLFREGDWRRVVPGIEAKPLWNERTTLLRCAPGAQMPTHDHEDVEYLLVMAGDLVIGSRTFVAGDAVTSPAGKDRFPHTTAAGCLLLRQIAA